MEISNRAEKYYSIIDKFPKNDWLPFARCHMNLLSSDIDNILCDHSLDVREQKYQMICKWETIVGDVASPELLQTKADAYFKSQNASSQSNATSQMVAEDTTAEKSTCQSNNAVNKGLNKMEDLPNNMEEIGNKRFNQGVDQTLTDKLQPSQRFNPNVICGVVSTESQKKTSGQKFDTLIAYPESLVVRLQKKLTRADCRNLSRAIVDSNRKSADLSKEQWLKFETHLLEPISLQDQQGTRKLNFQIKSLLPALQQ